jgi:hypothetical protein
VFINQFDIENPDHSFLIQENKILADMLKRLLIANDKSDWDKGLSLPSDIEKWWNENKPPLAPD